MQNDKLILVDFEDRIIGTSEKLEAHKKHLLHRAFSVFLYDGDCMLIQQRAAGKYHSGGKWANTCCSHPRDGETCEEAVHRRLREEVGMDCAVEELFSFICYAPFDDGLAEYELDHVFLGEYSGEVSPDPEEIAAVRRVQIDALEEDMRRNPADYAAWFHIAAPRVIAHLREKGAAHEPDFFK